MSIAGIEAEAGVDVGGLVAADVLAATVSFPETAAPRAPRDLRSCADVVLA